jgi:hypothetical protein
MFVLRTQSLFLLVIVFVVACVRPVAGTPVPVPSASPEASPVPTASPAPPAPADYPRPQDEARPETPAAIAAKHLAGWLHLPLEEIHVLGVTGAEVPAEAKKCRLTAELLEAPAEEQLITLEAGGKKYGYYVSGEALLLCPALIP